ncbi:hypothetical protein CEXT_684641 [Caerostris extrusa]|uniref:Uncharacterized protein n=1 Tax=Caerostris extrusa TaxID=172846 RepID=A0AAV4WFM4_CAEEX|nr:hypothetical protein CEXT_684641 [Caerostris extrusa]
MQILSPNKEIVDKVLLGSVNSNEFANEYLKLINSPIQEQDATGYMRTQRKKSPVEIQYYVTNNYERCFKIYSLLVNTCIIAKLNYLNVFTEDELNRKPKKHISTVRIE